jgi:hypothetical protein
MSAGVASLSLPQLVALLDQFHVELAFTLIGILVTTSVCATILFRTIHECVSGFFECLTKCAEARERYRRAREQNLKPKKPHVAYGPPEGCAESTAPPP